MHPTLLLALTMGNLAFAQSSYSNNTSPTNSPMIPGHDFVGCFFTSTGFPGWQLIATSDNNDPVFCAASCPTDYFGVYKNKCYCGNTLDSTAQSTAPGQCNAPCPGNPKAACGGDFKAQRRQVGAAADALLSVYKRVNAPTTAPATTLTGTITQTTTNTITSCPPEVTNCPVGHKTTEVKTITTTWCPEENQGWKHKKIACYGNWCAPEVPCNGPQCKHHRVICDDDKNKCWTEECSDNSWDKLVICNGQDCHYASWKGDECQHKVICYDGKCSKEKCYDNECKQNLVCTDDQCQYKQCTTGDCYNKQVCNGTQCQTQECCTGPSCPKPQPPQPQPGPSSQGKPMPTGQPGGNSGGNNGSGSSTQPPVTAGSERFLPAAGFLLSGALAGAAFLL